MSSPVENKFLFKYFFNEFYPSSSILWYINLYFKIFSGLIMAIAVEHCGLHNRIALRIIMLVCLLILNSIFWYRVAPRMNASLVSFLVCYYAWKLVLVYGILACRWMLVCSLTNESKNADMPISGKWNMYIIRVCWCMFMYQYWHSVWPPVTHNDMFANLFSLTA